MSYERTTMEEYPYGKAYDHFCKSLGEYYAGKSRTVPEESRQELFNWLKSPPRIRCGTYPLEQASVEELIIWVHGLQRCLKKPLLRDEELQGTREVTIRWLRAQWWVHTLARRLESSPVPPSDDPSQHYEDFVFRDLDDPKTLQELQQWTRQHDPKLADAVALLNQHYRAVQLAAELHDQLENKILHALGLGDLTKALTVPGVQVDTLETLSRAQAAAMRVLVDATQIPSPFSGKMVKSNSHWKTTDLGSGPVAWRPDNVTVTDLVPPCAAGRGQSNRQGAHVDVSPQSKGTGTVVSLLSFLVATARRLCAMPRTHLQAVLVLLLCRVKVTMGQDKGNQVLRDAVQLVAKDKGIIGTAAPPGKDSCQKLAEVICNSTYDPTSTMCSPSPPLPDEITPSGVRTWMDNMQKKYSTMLPNGVTGATIDWTHHTVTWGQEVLDLNGEKGALHTIVLFVHQALYQADLQQRRRTLENFIKGQETKVQIQTIRYNDESKGLATLNDHVSELTKAHMELQRKLQASIQTLQDRKQEYGQYSWLQQLFHSSPSTAEVNKYTSKMQANNATLCDAEANLQNQNNELTKAADELRRLDTQLSRTKELIAECSHNDQQQRLRLVGDLNPLLDTGDWQNMRLAELEANLERCLSSVPSELTDLWVDVPATVEKRVMDKSREWLVSQLVQFPLAWIGLPATLRAGEVGSLSQTDATAWLPDATIRGLMPILSQATQTATTGTTITVLDAVSRVVLAVDLLCNHTVDGTGSSEELLRLSASIDISSQTDLASTCAALALHQQILMDTMSRTGDDHTDPPAYGDTATIDRMRQYLCNQPAAGPNADGHGLLLLAARLDTARTAPDLYHLQAPGVRKQLQRVGKRLAQRLAPSLQWAVGCLDGAAPLALAVFQTTEQYWFIAAAAAGLVARLVMYFVREECPLPVPDDWGALVVRTQDLVSRSRTNLQSVLDQFEAPIVSTMRLVSLFGLVLPTLAVQSSNTHAVSLLQNWSSDVGNFWQHVLHLSMMCTVLVPTATMVCQHLGDAKGTSGTTALALTTLARDVRLVQLHYATSQTLASMAGSAAEWGSLLCVAYFTWCTTSRFYAADERGNLQPYQDPDGQTCGRMIYAPASPHVSSRVSTDHMVVQPLPPGDLTTRKLQAQLVDDLGPDNPYPVPVPEYYGSVDVIIHSYKTVMRASDLPLTAVQRMALTLKYERVVAFLGTGVSQLPSTSPFPPRASLMVPSTVLPVVVGNTCPDLRTSKKSVVMQRTFLSQIGVSQGRVAMWTPRPLAMPLVPPVLVGGVPEDHYDRLLTVMGFAWKNDSLSTKTLPEREYAKWAELLGLKTVELKEKNRSRLELVLDLVKAQLGRTGQQEARLSTMVRGNNLSIDELDLLRYLWSNHRACLTTKGVQARLTDPGLRPDLTLALTVDSPRVRRCTLPVTQARLVPLGAGIQVCYPAQGWVALETCVGATVRPTDELPTRLDQLYAYTLLLLVPKPDQPGEPGSLDRRWMTFCEKWFKDYQTSLESCWTQTDDTTSAEFHRRRCQALLTYGCVTTVHKEVMKALHEVNAEQPLSWNTEHMHLVVKRHIKVMMVP